MPPPHHDGHHAETEQKPPADSQTREARVIDLSEPTLVTGPPDSVRFKSRVVELAPGGSVGLHVTHRREELVVVLAGEGELLLPESSDGEEAGSGGRVLALSAGRAVYVPPETPHDIHNTGDAPLRYIYIVALLD